MRKVQGYITGIAALLICCMNLTTAPFYAEECTEGTEEYCIIDAGEEADPLSGPEGDTDGLIEEIVTEPPSGQSTEDILPLSAQESAPPELSIGEKVSLTLQDGETKK